MNFTCGLRNPIAIDFNSDFGAEKSGLRLGLSRQDFQVLIDFNHRNFSLGSIL
jgi:hypothetical protein